MKKIKTFFLTLIGTIFLYTNNTYATTKGTYVPVENNGAEKIVLIAIGVGLVSLVLFIGYKMDKKEESKKRREKFIKENKSESQDENDVYSMIYNTVNSEEDDIFLDEENDESDELDTTEEDIIFKESDLKNHREEFEDTGIFNINDEVEDIEPEVNENQENEEVYEQDESEEEQDEENDDEIEEYEETYPNIDFSENNKNIEKMISVFENSDSTMVFNSNDLKKEESNNVKGYDYEDDEDLSELESTIKEANIKKYTRKKKKEEPKKNVKRYTRKKVEIVEKEEIEDKVEEVIKEEKPKRGRPRKTEEAEKPKRGRPKKTETTTAKRGRPRKTETTSKTKSTKGTKKTTTKK